MNPETMNFEASLKRIEEIVDLLENQNPDLEESIKLFEEGARLAADCGERLKNAELKISELTVNGGKE